MSASSTCAGTSTGAPATRRTSRATSPARSGPTSTASSPRPPGRSSAGIRCRHPPTSRPRWAGSESETTMSSWPTTTRRGRLPDASGGCSTRSGCARTCSTAGSRRGSARSIETGPCSPSGQSSHRGSGPPSASSMPTGWMRSAAPARCSMRAHSRASPVTSPRWTPFPATSLARAAHPGPRTSTPRRVGSSPPTSCGGASRRSAWRTGAEPSRCADRA